VFAAERRCRLAGNSNDFPPTVVRDHLLTSRCCHSTTKIGHQKRALAMGHNPRLGSSRWQCPSQSQSPKFRFITLPTNEEVLRRLIRSPVGNRMFSQVEWTTSANLSTHPEASAWLANLTRSGSCNFLFTISDPISQVNLFLSCRGVQGARLSCSIAAPTFARRHHAT